MLKIMQSFVPLKHSEQTVRTVEIQRNSEHMKPIIQESLPVSASAVFLFRGFKRLSFSLKVLTKTYSFMRVSTVVEVGLPQVLDIIYCTLFEIPNS